MDYEKQLSEISPEEVVREDSDELTLRTEEVERTSHMELER